MLRKLFVVVFLVMATATFVAADTLTIDAPADVQLMGTNIVDGMVVSVGFNTKTGVATKITRDPATGTIVSTVQLAMPVNGTGETALWYKPTGIDRLGNVVGTAMFTNSQVRMVTTTPAGVSAVANLTAGASGTATAGASVANGIAFGGDNNSATTVGVGDTATSRLSNSGNTVGVAAEYYNGNVLAVAGGGASSVFSWWENGVLDTASCSAGTNCNLWGVSQTLGFAAATNGETFGILNLTSGDYTAYGSGGQPAGFAIDASGGFWMGINMFDDAPWLLAPNGTLGLATDVWNAINPGNPLPAGLLRIVDIDVQGNEVFFTGEDGFFVSGGLNLGGDPLQTSTAPVPEPATMLLLGTGLMALAGGRKLFKKH